MGEVGEGARGAWGTDPDFLGNRGHGDGGRIGPVLILLPGRLMSGGRGVLRGAMSEPLSMVYLEPGGVAGLQKNWVL